MELPDRPEAPHTAVIWLTVEVHELLSTGELGGRPTHKENKVLSIKGKDREDCLNKLSDFLKGLPC